MQDRQTVGDSSTSSVLANPNDNNLDNKVTNENSGLLDNASSSHNKDVSSSTNQNHKTDSDCHGGGNCGDGCLCCLCLNSDASGFMAIVVIGGALVVVPIAAAVYSVKSAIDSFKESIPYGIVRTVSGVFGGATAGVGGWFAGAAISQALQVAPEIIESVSVIEGVCIGSAVTTAISGAIRYCQSNSCFTLFGRNNNRSSEREGYEPINDLKLDLEQGIKPAV